MELNKEQKDFLDKYTEGKWTLNEKTGLVDIEGSFNCFGKRLTDFKGVKFGVVTGHFDCDNNSLTSLEGAPKKVGGYFSCDNNSLTSLEGAPQEVGGYFYCSNNSLTSLEGAPKKVVGNFSCYNNSLTSLEGAPQEVGGYFYCSNNSISEKTLKLVWETMQEKKIDYWTALSLLKSQISNGCWEKMSRGLDVKLSKDAQKGYLTLDQFGLFG
jgi:hypothetical protein